jgi:hypothetical protein
MVFELLFLALAFATLISLVTALAMAIRRRRVARLLLSVGIVWAMYLTIVAAVSAATPQKRIPMGQEQCFDEMCFSVAHVEAFSELGLAAQPTRATGRFYVVTVRMTSRSRGRPQREGGLRALLWSAGKYYHVSAEGQTAWEMAHAPAAGLTARLNPGESLLSVQVFDLPNSVTTPGLVLSHGFTPGYFVIGECPMFHPPAIMLLAQ